MKHYLLAPAFRPHLMLASFCLGAVAIALGFQLFLGWPPCPLCLWQRGPHLAVVMVSVLAAMTYEEHPTLAKHLLFLSALIMLGNAGLALYHSLVERHVIEASETCTGGGGVAESLEALKAQIMGAKVARCDVPAEFFPGFTMANANGLLCLALSVFGFRAWSQK